MTIGELPQVQILKGYSAGHSDNEYIIKNSQELVSGLLAMTKEEAHNLVSLYQQKLNLVVQQWDLLREEADKRR